MKNFNYLPSFVLLMTLLSGCGGSGAGTVGNDGDPRIDGINGAIEDGETPPPSSKTYYGGPAASDVQERHEANDAPYTNYPSYDAANIDTTTLSGKLTGTTTLDKTKQYKIDGLVKIDNGATLTIPAGTVIFGDENGDDYIVVMQGAKIIADGTESEPIVFTSETALKDPLDSDVGQWGGLVLLGKAPTNHNNPRYEVDENDPDFAFGGTVTNDNSGILRHIKILNSGKTLGTDLEINGLSLAGVGSGTTVENITVINSSDDCVEIWGGTVNVSNISMANCQDDSFDLDYGYVGTATNITVVQTEQAHAGFEISSGGDNPMTAPTIENFSIVKVDGSDEGGIYIKDDTTAPSFVNGVVTTLSDDANINTKKAFTPTQKSTIAFKDVILK